MSYFKLVSGWWFQTCFFPFHIWDVILPIDELIFFKMVKTTNQLKWGWITTYTIFGGLNRRGKTMGDLAQTQIWSHRFDRYYPH